MKEIKISQGKTVLVDDWDYEWLSQYKWYLGKSKRKSGDDLYYAWTHQYNGHVTSMHRILTNAQPGQIVDHRNGNGLDNQRLNLRTCTKAQNARNIKARWGRSQYKGVYWHKHRKKWAVEINIGGQRKSLGYYADEIAAARAYDKAALNYFREFADINFPLAELV